MAAWRHASARHATESLAAAEALRKSEQRFRTAFDRAPIGMALLDTEGHWFEVNRSLCEMLGYSEAELVGRLFSELTHPEDIAADFASLRRTVDGEMDMHEREKRYIHKEGHVVWVQLRASAVRDEKGATLYLIAQYQDVTRQKRAEEQFLQAQKMEAVGLLAGGVAHDFNNLVTAITGYGELLLASFAADDARREYADQIRKAGDRAAALTRQLLAFSRRQVLEPRVLDLNRLVSGMQGLLQRLIGETIAVRTSTAPDPWRVRADPTQIEQALLNLVVNARDAMPDGGTVTIETRNVTLGKGTAPPRGLPMPPGDYATLVISDTGVGMSLETQSHLFEPFFTTKQRGLGTGLGLSTTYGIVKQSGGFISCESQPGRGTSFQILLPRVEAEVEEPAPAPAVQGRASEGQRLLLVEDEPEVRSLLQKILAALGYEVLTAAGPREALELASAFAGTIHMMVTDVVMPGMSGRQLADRLASARPEMKVLFVSGYTDDAIARHGVLEPGTAFLQKPFSPRALAEKVAGVLGAPLPKIKTS